ncbi:PfkB family carbohydrate kinase [Jannaschia seohaensis]|uniref:Sulfofructose kinase n=1 Tax=Jannaschia seohaensis TaxID=475081 RepID=A0A2Y9B091_9RHOB|nr:PfkB family carbohydrate kinase [Jannaschia seohaensis]PWJ15075.1 sulfofructose kinase [Jannaschia seohaensis]SSA49924.1 sulfofructose kinase [Jannaschia seohaensis]
MTRLLVAGIAVMDYVQRVDALPRTEGKHRSRSFERIGGGCAANAAVGAARLGGAVTLVTRMGTDATGDELAAMLEAAGVTPAFARGGRTPLSSVMVDPEGERMIVNFPGEDLPTAPPALPDFDAALVDCRWPEAAEAVLRSAREAGRPAVLDGEKYTPEPLAALATHTVFSAPGLRDFAGCEDLGEALAQAARRLPGHVAYTDGPIGVVWADGLHVPAPAIDAVDTLGAGDLWHGAFALALGRGQDRAAASDYANRAAALKCTRPGGWDAYPTEKDLR